MNKPSFKDIKFLKQNLPEIREFLFSRGKEPELSLKMIPQLSNFMWGLSKKALTIIAARTSEGKSTMGLQFGYDLAMQNPPKKVLFLSLETTVEKMGTRLFCLHSHYSNVKAFRGGIKDESYIWDNFVKQVEDIPLIITDMVGKNWEDIDNFIEETNFSPDVVIVDYIQTIADREGKNKIETINEYIRRFRELAIRKNFAGIICSQINRSMADEKDKTPQLHQLKGSGFLEEHADVVLLLSWPFKYLKPKEGTMTTYDQFHKFIVYLAKNKDGLTGFKKLKFTPEYYLFEDWVDLPKTKEDYNEPKEKDSAWR